MGSKGKSAAFVGKVELRGATELLKALSEMDRKVSGQVLRAAMREGAKTVQAEAAQQAPVETGTLKESIKVRAGRRKKGRTAVIVTSGEGFFKGETFYSAFIELGHYLGSRKLGDKRRWVSPNPFMRRAAVMKESEVKRSVAVAIYAGVQKAMQKAKSK